VTGTVAKVLAEPAESLTDLLLGLVSVWLALQLRGRRRLRSRPWSAFASRRRLRSRPEVHRHWVASFAWAGVAALAGAVHHAVLVPWTRWADLSWSVITVMIVIAVSYLLAGSVVEVLGTGHAREFWLLRSIGLVAYIGLAATGHAGVGSMLACEGLTMASVVALWVIAAYRHHPLGRPVLLAILASGAAGATQALSQSVTGLIGLDPTSTYHLAQIGGMVLLFWGLTRGRPEPDEAAEPEPATQAG
jgi:hypothetical protein